MDGYVRNVILHLLSVQHDIFLYMCHCEMQPFKEDENEAGKKNASQELSMEQKNPKK